MKQLYKIKAIPKSFVWGGSQLIEKYHLDGGWKQVGTIYLVIAIPGVLDNLVEDTDEHLSDFYQNHRDLFQIEDDTFPIRLTITCNAGLQSYQLHPDDAYALAHEGCRGKVSGSVALFPQANDPARHMLFGNKCHSLEEFKELVEKQDWDHLFRTIEKPSGAYLHTPAGVIHGGRGTGKINATWGTNGDITYRFYDYGRNDPQRPLQLQQVFDCVNIPEIELPAPMIPAPTKLNGIDVYEYYDRAGEYTAKRLKVHGQGEYSYDGFAFYGCADGEGTIEGRAIRGGQTIFVPNGYGKIRCEGNMDLLMISCHH